MLITVAICTWNRAKFLDTTLAEIGKARIPAGVEWELIVVNNNSTDETAEVLRKHEMQGGLPLRSLFEMKQGNAPARNCAMQAARGEFIVWTDDDVLVDAGWLEELVGAYRRWPQASFFGGTVDPLYETEPPVWMKKHRTLVEGPFAMRQLGREERALGQNEMPFGANMALRWKPGADSKAGIFEMGLGRIGKGMMSGEETAMLEKLQKAGKQGVWVGQSQVRHFIPKKRLRAGYIWKFWVGIGATEVRRNGVPAGPRILGVPRWMLRRWIAGSFGAVFLFPIKNARWAACFKSAAEMSGAIREVRNASGHAATPAGRLSRRAAHKAAAR